MIVSCHPRYFLSVIILIASVARAKDVAVPSNLTARHIPPLADTLREDVGRYLEFRTAEFVGWHPVRREILLSTRFANVNQLHYATHPGGARQQLTFGQEPVGGGAWQPVAGKCLALLRDLGGTEAYQIYRQDVEDGRLHLLTDGKSRYTGVHWSHDGKRIAYASTQRTGSDNDIWIMDPFQPQSAKLLRECQGGGWNVLDWSPDGQQLLLAEFISATESRIHLCEVPSGTSKLFLPKPGQPSAAYAAAKFAPHGAEIFVVNDAGSEFQQLAAYDRAGEVLRVLTKSIPWDVDGYDIAPDGKQIALITNEAGASVLRVIAAQDGSLTMQPKLAMGVVSDLAWHPNGQEIGFTFTNARSPTDVWSVEFPAGNIHRWTTSETGGLNPARFAESELVRWKAFDDLEITGFLYRPEAKKFPGKRPIIINIHGGPEGQSRPQFSGRSNYYLDELGVAVLYPNVRGSEGFGKTFLTLDNGMKREDSVKDIGALLDWIAQQPDLDASRVAVVGGSYGGYMVLASLVHFGTRLRCGVDAVGISNFVSFLEHTQSYRRDLRRVEYGDEREPAMRTFLEKISPLGRVEAIQSPLFVVQGLNDPRVPASEAEQIVAALEKQKRPVWYLLAQDEGHGFRKRENNDFQFLAQIKFFQEFLLPQQR